MSENRNPILTGTVQKSKEDNYEKIGKISLWEKSSDNEKAPKMTGTLETEKGQKYYVSLWTFKPKTEEDDL